MKRSPTRIPFVLLGAALLGAPGCVLTFHDVDGVEILDADVAALHPGETTRSEVLERMGPPTGVFRTRIFDAFTRDAAFSPSAAAGRVDDDVLVWQRVTLDGTALLVPVLFTWAWADVSARTLMVAFDRDDRVTEVAFREDGP